MNLDVQTSDKLLQFGSHFGKSNVARLTIAQALAGANSTVVYATAAIVGHTMAPRVELATLPISTFVVGMAASALPSGAIARRYGRLLVFLMGTGAGAFSGILAAISVVAFSFWLFCAATFLGGVYAAVVLTFRFAAAECVERQHRAKALSIVMAGGVAAGIVGPQLVTLTMHLWQPYLFVGTFVSQALVASMSAIVLMGVRLPPPAPLAASGHKVSKTLRSPRFITAAICGVVSYMLMNFLMTSAPLAMHLCGIPTSESNLGIQWHVIAMYAPSFATGRLITRFGPSQVVAAGLLLLGTASGVGLTGIQVHNYWLSLIFLGIGWNLSFLGASAMILESGEATDRAKVQSLNDFIVFGAMTLGSLASGALVTTLGWKAVLLSSFIPLTLAFAALAARTTSRNGNVQGAGKSLDQPHHNHGSVT
jgi:MFS family permease